MVLAPNGTPLWCSEYNPTRWIELERFFTLDLTPRRVDNALIPALAFSQVEVAL